MNIQEMQAIALRYCIDISNDYTEEEVKRFAPPSVQKAWDIGNQYRKNELKESRKILDGFTL